MVAKHSINQKKFCYAATLTTAQVKGLPEEVDEKNRCNFGALETRILPDIFIVNRNNREAQNELRRSTKTPEEVYRIALSYERGDNYAKTYVSTTGGTPSSSTTGGGAFQIKTEPVGTIRGGYRNSRQRGRGPY